MIDTQTYKPTLTSADRCDYCHVAKAVYKAVFLNGSLTFCGHCFRAYESGINDSALEIHTNELET